MPNWVFNQLRIGGSEEALDRFAEQASAPAQFRYEEQTLSELSFWNFVRPDPSIIHEYWGDEPRKATLEEALKYDSNHWYDWNIRNWGCKWDASDVHAERWGSRELAYDFNTPWGPPEQAFAEMVRQYPELEFNLIFSEEQGWGGEWHGNNGEYVLVREWDIPETHAEHMEQFKYCRCEEMTDEELEWMYEDCPRKIEATAKQVHQGA